MLKKKRFRLFCVEISVFALTFLIHIFFIRNIHAPQYVDEYRTFLTGEFLAGRYDLSLLHAYEEANMYYGFGQVIFYIPFFWIFHSIDNVFKAALIFNGVIMSLVPVLTVKIFRILLSENSEFERAVLAFAIGIFPPLIYSSKTVTNETFLLFFPVLILYLLVVLSVNEDKIKKIILSILLGLCSMWMYTLNARGLAITFSVALCVLIMEGVKKEKKVSVFPYISTSIIVYIINYFTSRYIIRQFHSPIGGSSVRNYDINLLSRIKQLHISRFFTALSSWSGNWLYMAVVSGGLLVLLVVAAKQRQKQTIDGNIMLYVLASAFITSAMLFGVDYKAYSNPGKRLIDYYIYGRYYDLLIPLILIVGIYFLIRYEMSCKRYLVTILIMMCTCLMASVCVAGILIKTESGGIRILNIGTLTAFLGGSFITNPSYRHFVGISIAASMVCAILILLGKRKKPILIAAVFSSLFLFAASHVMASCKESSAYSGITLSECENMFSEYEEIDEKYKTVYYLYENSTFRGVNVQYALRGWKAAQVDMKSDYNGNLDMIEENSFIYTKGEMFLDLLYENCKFIKGESGGELYAYGEDLIEELNIENQDRSNVSLNSLFGSEGSALSIAKGASSYGPYLNLDAGTYYVEIDGKYLDTVSATVTKNFASDLVECSITDQTKEELCLCFTSDTAMESVEIFVYNADSPYVTINNMYFYDEEKQQVFAASGKDLNATAWSHVIAQDGTAHLNPVILDKGKYLIRLEGTDVTYLSAVSDDLQEGYLREFERGENYIVYELKCEEFLKYPEILFESKTAGEKHIESIVIERIDE